ncbi:MAG TPA: autotransporter outer membrane beta-barrel domain-containing protein [Xanthobacteraceae bacterium]|nr:autotransporter outer membrane beta-barrel domain-containing protein [Xanthobacteraceae bacterium]
MKVIRVLSGSAFAFLFGYAIFGGADFAQAQSVCSCPAGFSPVGSGRCQSQQLFCANGAPAIANPDTGGFFCQDESTPSPRVSNATCHSATPNIGQIAASQQQLSFSTVQGVLRTRRDQLQGPLGSQPSAGSPLAYSSFNLDDSYRLLGYAPADKRPVYGADKNPLHKAPPAPAGTTGPTWAAWVEGLGDWEKRNPLNANDVGRTQDTYGVHAGLDATWGNTWLPGDFIVAGLVTNWTSSHISLSGSPATLRLEGPGVGLYSMYVNGGFSADLVGKFDFLNLKEDLGGLGGLPNSSIDVTNAGLSGNVQYKNKMGNAFIEPTMGFSFTRTMFGDNAALMGLQDGSTLRLQAGARFGAAFDVSGISVEPTLALLAYSNVIADGTTVATVSVPVPVTPTDQGLVRGEVDPELNLDFNNGYSAYVRGSLRFGGELFGGSAKVGLRKQF